VRDLTFFLQALVSVFAVVDPLAAAVLFGVMTAGDSDLARRRMACRAALMTAGLLSWFLLFGGLLFALFSITTSAFRIAGGLVIGIMALDMLKATHTGVRTTAEEQTDGIAKEDVSITPIAVPLLAGPGAISTVMILASRDGLAGYAMVLSAIVLVSLASWLLLREAGRVVDLLGHTGINVIGRLMGLIVLAVAVQFVVDGVLELLPAVRETLGAA
jgi:multiple antibiotic resistance protein